MWNQTLWEEMVSEMQQNHGVQGTSYAAAADLLEEAGLDQLSEFVRHKLRNATPQVFLGYNKDYMGSHAWWGIAQDKWWVGRFIKDEHREHIPYCLAVEIAHLLGKYHQTRSYLPGLEQGFYIWIKEGEGGLQGAMLALYEAIRVVPRKVLNDLAVRKEA